MEYGDEEKDKSDSLRPEKRGFPTRNSVMIYQITFWVCLLGAIVATIVIRSGNFHPIYWGIPLILISGGSYILGRGHMEELRKSEEERRKRMKERRKRDLYF